MILQKYFGFLLLFTINALGQSDSLIGWHTFGKENKNMEGICLKSTYSLLQHKKSTPVIVAVIDTGIDTAHEDLKNVLWKNPREIPGNGNDDDGNGYIDDVYGWNFIGGKDGRNIEKDVKEQVRIFHKYKDQFWGKWIKADSLAPKEKQEYTIWKLADSLINEKPEEQVELMFIELAFKTGKKHEKILQEELGKDEFTGEEIEKFIPETIKGKRAKLGYIMFLKNINIEMDEKNTELFAQLDEYIKEKHKAFDAKQQQPENVRNEIVKDNYDNFNDRFYGNNDVMGPKPLHGTHVSGIIAAQRNNGLGCDGIADNAKIMMIRVVPDGDEYDKDIALAIRYAVDNGAKVINMSFGKDISPEKWWVDEAVRYAEMKDVLLVHAAGNDAENIDSSGNYPNPDLLSYHKIASNFITVGATCPASVSQSRVADFSNFGKKTVDVFAPGVKIYSTVPGCNYAYQKGTSMASPVVAGVAALIRSYYPQLTAIQVKNCIEKSVDIDSSLLVEKPGTGEKVPLYSLCSSGGCINALNAIKMAEAMVPANNKELKKLPLPKSRFKNVSPKS